MKEINLNVNDSILHDIQLIDAKMVSLHCDIKEESLGEKSLETSISVSSKGKTVNDKIGESIIEIKIFSQVFEMNIIQTGRFKKNDKIEISEDVFENFLATQGIRILWSYARENVYEITCKMLRKPIMLPTLDVMKALKEK